MFRRFIGILCLLNSVQLFGQSLSRVSENDTEIVWRFENPDALPLPPYRLVLDANDQFSLRNARYSTVEAQVSVPVSEDVLEIVGNGVVRKHRVKQLSLNPVLDAASGTRILTYAELVIRKGEASFTRTQKQQNFNALFSTGEWLKVAVSRHGIHEITGEDLTSLGIDLAAITPSQIEVWAMPAEMLPHVNTAPRPSLQQVPILMQDGGDDRFDENDRILFYQSGPYVFDYENTLERWDHILHKYSRFSFVFIRLDGQGSDALSEPAFVNQAPVTSSRRLLFKEEELYKSEPDIKSGTEWFGQRFSTSVSSGASSIFTDTLADFSAGSQVQIAANLVGRATNSSSRFEFFLNGSGIGDRFISPISSLNDIEGLSGLMRLFFTTLDNTQLSGGIFDLQAQFSHSSSSATGFIDYIHVWYTSNLRAENGFLELHRIGSDPQGNLVLRNFDAEPLVLDVTNPQNPFRLAVEAESDHYNASLLNSGARHIVAQTQFFKPASILEVSNQELRKAYSNPDMLIVTSEELLDAAQAFAAYRSGRDGLNIEIVTQNQIFNEFSGGMPDFVAIRDFVKYVYDQSANPDPSLKYLLLFGDASYDYKGIEGSAGEVLTNHVFTYQTRESLDRVQSFGSDDFFGLLDDGEGEWAGNVPSSQLEMVDIGIGRLPVQSSREAQVMLEKIQLYESAASKGDWRSQFTFVSDDDQSGSSNDTDLHLINADVTAESIDRDLAGVRVKKIHLLSYNAEVTTVGRRFPQGTQDLIDVVNEGTLVINYSGHGDEQLLADERLFQSEQISQFTNEDRPSIFVTATCSFGRFDDVFDQSGAEKALLYEGGGMVASFTTTRVVYTSRLIGNNNFGLNIALTRHMTDRDENDAPLSLGEIYRRTKNESSGAVINGRKFALLGDPSMKMGLPERRAEIISVNSNPLPDTLTMRALDQVELQGRIMGSDSSTFAGFNGEVQVLIYDGARPVPYPEKSWTEDFCEFRECRYFIQNDVLFSGKASVENGLFSARFLLPKDLSFVPEPGRIFIYANSGETDAVASFSNVNFNGVNPDAVNDGQGPEIEVYLNEDTFTNEILVNDRATLRIGLQDPSGINTAGTGVGHELIAQINTQPETVVVLNDYYESELNDFTRGEIRYTLPELPAGPYRLSVRAWDVFNNPSEESISFNVSDPSELEVRNLYNYPNPMTEFTYFVFEHNQPSGSLIDVVVRIYTLSGRPVSQIEESISSLGNVERILWNGRDMDGDRLATGTYLYTVKVKSDVASQTNSYEKVEKLVIIR